jgi:hypothetical protein
MTAMRAIPILHLALLLVASTPFVDACVPMRAGSTRCDAICISPNVRKKCLAAVCPADGALLQRYLFALAVCNIAGIHLAPAANVFGAAGSPERKAVKCRTLW